MKESEIQRACLDYLAARHVFAIRMNTGAMSGQHNGRNWFLKFGLPGMADVLAFTPHSTPIAHGTNISMQVVVWIEVKNERGKQSALQKSFQQRVEAEGHRYLLVRSVQDLIDAGI